MPKRASLTTSLDGVKSALAASAAGNSELEARVTAAKKHADDRRKKQEKLQTQWSDLEKREVVGREDRKDLDARVRASTTRTARVQLTPCPPRDQHVHRHTHHGTLMCRGLGERVWLDRDCYADTCACLCAVAISHVGS